MKDKKEIEQLASDYQSKYLESKEHHCSVADHFKAGYEQAQQSQFASIQQAVELALNELRSDMVNKMPAFSAHEKTGTKKHSEWVGFGNAITVLDNFNLSLPKVLEQADVSDGWIEINSQDDLPKETGFNWVIDNDYNMYLAEYQKDFLQFFADDYVYDDYELKFYKPIVKPTLPKQINNN